jgi:hypothetical protein
LMMYVGEAWAPATNAAAATPVSAIRRSRDSNAGRVFRCRFRSRRAFIVSLLCWLHLLGRLMRNLLLQSVCQFRPCSCIASPVMENAVAQMLCCDATQEYLLHRPSSQATRWPMPTSTRVCRRCASGSVAERVRLALVLKLAFSVDEQTRLTRAAPPP